MLVYVHRQDESDYAGDENRQSRSQSHFSRLQPMRIPTRNAQDGISVGIDIVIEGMSCEIQGL